MKGILLMFTLTFVSTAQTFDFHVERVRPLRNQPGQLHIDPEQIIFRSDDGKTDFAIRMEDLRTVSVANPKALRFETYDVSKWKPFERREHVFRTSADAPLDQIAEFFAGRSFRPVIGHYWNGATFEVAAFHRTKLSGTTGTLRIGPESIQYLTDKAADARTWLYRDIETIGRPDAFRFRVTTSRETYVLELKTELPESAYELAWTHVYKIQTQNAGVK